jgi:hypothetical protein
MCYATKKKFYIVIDYININPTLVCNPSGIFMNVVHRAFT